MAYCFLEMQDSVDEQLYLFHKRAARAPGWLCKRLICSVIVEQGRQVKNVVRLLTYLLDGSLVSFPLVCGEAMLQP